MTDLSPPRRARSRRATAAAVGREDGPEPAAPADARGRLLLAGLGRPAAVPAERLDGAAVRIDPDGTERAGHVPTLRRAADTRRAPDSNRFSFWPGVSSRTPS